MNWHSTMGEMWVVYRPTTRDYPGQWVLRKWTITMSGIYVSPDFGLFATLALAREAVPPGAKRLRRMPTDDAAIEETWI